MTFVTYERAVHSLGADVAVTVSTLSGPVGVEVGRVVSCLFLCRCIAPCVLSVLTCCVCLCAPGAVFTVGFNGEDSRRGIGIQVSVIVLYAT